MLLRSPERCQCVNVLRLFIKDCKAGAKKRIDVIANHSCCI